MDPLRVLEAVFPTFAIVALAYLFQRYKKLEIRPIVETALYLASPCLVFRSLSENGQRVTQLLPVVLSATTVILAALFISRSLFSAFHLENPDARTLPVVLINSGNLGIPISLFAFGEGALPVAVAYYVTCSVATYSIGIYLAARGSPDANKPYLEIFKLPLLYAVVLGTAVALTGTSLPPLISRPISLLADAAIPLFVITLGMSLVGVRSSKELRAGACSASMRISLGFLLGLACVGVFGLTGLVRGVVLLQSSMPPAVASLMLAQKYSARPGLVASSVMIGTLMSLVTIPLILGLLI